MDALSQIDLAFCVDHTSSMTPFIEAARQRIAEILAAVQTMVQADLHVAAVAYRDHGVGPPVVEVQPFRGDLASISGSLESLQVASPQGNTDAAEAVFSGLLACVDDLQWRPQAIRTLMLIGDAPPHACGATGPPYPDRFPEADPSGVSLMSMSARIEAGGIALYGLGMVPSVHPMYDGVLAQSFEFLARTTGGRYHAAASAQAAMSIVAAIGERAGKQLDFDRRLWERLTSKAGATPTAAQIEELTPDLEQALAAAPHEIHASVERLRKRSILPEQRS